MRIKITLIAAVLMLAFSSTAVSQAYWYLQQTGSDAGFDNLFTGSTTAALSAPSDDVLSSSQSLPFSWDFYGVSVSSYKVSDNGYITFDGTASTSSPANSTLPGSVNAAIFVFWDDLQVQNTGSGSVDEVRSWTYGSSPNRTHVIQWFSCSIKPGSSSNANWMYAALLIYEGGDFDVVLPGSNSANPGSATIGVQNGLGTDYTEVTGSPTIILPASIDYTDGTDDVVYSFKYGTQPSYDLSVISETGIGLAEPAGTGITVTGEIQNFGAMTITDMDMHYTINGSGQVDQSMSGLSISPSGGTYTYSFTTQFNPATAGTVYSIEIWADNINGNADEDMTNDRLNKDVIGTLGVTTTRVPLMEEFTGAWCQFCPDGAVYMETISNTHGNAVSLGSVHSGDDMTLTGYTDLTGRYDMTGWPGAMVDRTVWAGQAKAPLAQRSDWSPTVAAALNVGAIGTMTFENFSYNGGTRQLSVDVVTTFDDYTAGDIRVNLYIIEETVTGSGSGYDQVNFYNGQAGHPYYQAGNPIIGYEHKHVIRAALPDFNGQAGVIPDPVAVGTKYTQNFTTTIPSTWDESELSLIGFASNYAPGESDRDVVINSANMPLMASGVEPTDAVNELKVFPNPAKDLSIVYFNLDKPAKVEVSVYNVVGQKVVTLRQGNFVAGQHRAGIDVSALNQGVYFVTVKADESETTTKLFVVK